MGPAYLLHRAIQHYFWLHVFSSQVWLGAIAYLILFCVIVTSFLFLSWYSALAVTGALLVWIGPAVLLTPLVLMFIIPNVLAGDVLIPVGCGRRSDGSLVCM